MIFYLIKNNFKLIFRNRLAVVILLIAPALTIALLSNAFDSMMRSYETPESFTVGYRCRNEDVSKNMDVIKSSGKDAGIILNEYSEGDPSELIINYDLSAFVEFNEKDYMLYKSGDHKPEGAVTEYFIDRVMSEGVNTALDMIAPSAKMTSALPVTKLEAMPAISSTDYYGIIYIVYMSCIGIICATGMLNSEKKNGIEKKYQVCSVSPLGLYIARLLPAVLVIIVCMFIETVVTVLMFGIHWGAPLISASIVIMSIIASCALGFMLYSISRNIAVTIIALFSVIWVVGFLGGSFETYMFSTVSDGLKRISPIYYANRALVELSCMGRSDQIGNALLIMGAITAVCSLIAIGADIIRRRGKA